MMTPRPLLCLTALLTLVITASAQPVPPSPRLYVCGKAVTGTPVPAMREGVLVASWADCARAAGATARRDAADNSLTLTSARGKRLTASPGALFTVDGDTRALSTASTVESGELVGPVKPLFEALDAVLDWDPKTLTAQVGGKILKLEAHGDDLGVGVTFVTSLPARADLSTIKDPRRAVIELPNTYLGRWRELTYLNECGVLRLRCGQYDKQPPTVRLVADLREQGPAPSFERREDGCGGRLLFGKLQGDEPLLDRAHPKLLKVLTGSPQADTGIVTAFLTDPVKPEYDVLRDPYRVLLDFGGVEMPDASSEARPEVPFVDSVKLMAQVRLALYMKDLVPFAIRQLDSPDRVQIIFRRDRLAGKRIMVDAGHGGKDSGARGRTLLEKDINLDVARRTVSRLALMDARPYLTREDDTFIDLYARPRLTNELPADLFVSIHCNAFQWDRGSGTQTYYCHPQSKGLAVVMQDALWPQLKRKDGGVHQARFCVVRETQIPAVLVELLFLDNKNEEALLGQPETRQAAAVGICEGLRRYLEGTSSVAPAVLQESTGG
ncbi:MAG: N-acetylmuramoyl-L-alanine amidase [Armatimonadota bacterium]